MSKFIEVNAPSIEITDKTERPTSFMISETVAHTESPTGEKLEIVRAAFSPFIFELRGEKLTAKINIEPMLQEAMLHVLRENAGLEPAPEPERTRTTVEQRAIAELERQGFTTDRNSGGVEAYHEPGDIQITKLNVTALLKAISAGESE